LARGVASIFVLRTVSGRCRARHQDARHKRHIGEVELQSLRGDHRAAVVLRDVEGLSNAEVAEVLGISVAAAKSRIHRGRMQIRDALANWEEG
jgi:DNA-directed RNA polymerase specialized sigma24 family protein